MITLGQANELFNHLGGMAKWTKRRSRAEYALLSVMEEVRVRNRKTGENGRSAVQEMLRQWRRIEGELCFSVRYVSGQSAKDESIFQKEGYCARSWNWRAKCPM